MEYLENIKSQIFEEQTHQEEKTASILICTGTSEQNLKKIEQVLKKTQKEEKELSQTAPPQFKSPYISNDKQKKKQNKTQTARFKIKKVNEFQLKNQEKMREMQDKRKEKQRNEEAKQQKEKELKLKRREALVE